MKAKARLTPKSRTKLRNPSANLTPEEKVTFYLDMVRRTQPTLDTMIKYYRDEVYHLKGEDLLDLTGLASATYHRMLQPHQAAIDARNVLRIVKGLNLPVPVALRLAEMTGHTLIDDYHEALLYMLISDYPTDALEESLALWDQLKGNKLP